MGPGGVNVGTGYRRKECLFKLPFATKQGEREIPYPSLSPPLDCSFLPSLQMSGMWHCDTATPADWSGWQKPCGLKSFCNPSLIFNSCQWRHLGWRSGYLILLLFWCFPFFHRSICCIWKCVFVNEFDFLKIFEFLVKNFFFPQYNMQMKIFYLQSSGIIFRIVRFFWDNFFAFLWLITLCTYLLPLHQIIHRAAHKQFPVCNCR